MDILYWSRFCMQVIGMCAFQKSAYGPVFHVPGSPPDAKNQRIMISAQQYIDLPYDVASEHFYNTISGIQTQICVSYSNCVIF